MHPIARNIIISVCLGSLLACLEPLAPRTVGVIVSASVTAAALAGVGLLVILALRWAVRQLQGLDKHLDELDGISPIEGATHRATEQDQ